MPVFEVTAGFGLSVEQHQVVERILTAGHSVDAVVGVAGSGKNTLMQACRLARDVTGTTYTSAALASVAAAYREAGPCVPSRTLVASLRSFAGKLISTACRGTLACGGDQQGPVSVAHAFAEGPALVPCRAGFPWQGTQDCGAHEWYNQDGRVARCYHCEVGERPWAGVSDDAVPAAGG